MQDLPAAVLTATIWAYWMCVAWMIVRARRKHRKRSGAVPRQPLERRMWVIWVPVVILWMTLPYLAATRDAGSWSIPLIADAPPWNTLRWAAASIGVTCLALTIECWMRMGASWGMAVTPGETTELVTGGLYAHIRHPIYALSIVLMLSSAVVVPTPPMFVVAAIHVALMIIKASNEERFLLAAHGEVYARYSAQTGRFFPHLAAARRVQTRRDEHPQGEGGRHAACGERRNGRSHDAGDGAARYQRPCRPSGWRGAAGNRARPAGGRAFAGARPRAHLGARAR